MKFAYYPGCSLQATSKEFDQSSQETCRALGIELNEIPDWNCCGATSAHGTNRLLSIALPARNLALAGETGQDVVIPCAACYQRLRVARHVLQTDPGMRARVAGITGHNFDETVGVKSLLEVVAGLDPEVIRHKLLQPLNGLKAVCYYGCLLVRPPGITGFDDPEDPQTMDRLVALCGAEPLDWGYKTECCGASMGISNEAVTLRLVHKIMRAADEAGADFIVLACPLCQNNLDARQGHVNRAYGTNFRIPVLYFTQMVGLALGLNPGKLGLKTHFVKTGGLLTK